MQRTYKTGAYAARQSQCMNAEPLPTDPARAEPVRFDTKIAVLLREDLEPWQRLNVTAFLVSGIGSPCPR